MPDEATNGADAETPPTLEAATGDLAGGAVILVHDRFSLSDSAPISLPATGEDNFEACEADKIRRLGPDSVEPKRVKYKKFAR